MNYQHENATEPDVYRQEEVLIQVPLTFQMTRTLRWIPCCRAFPTKSNARPILHELDDAALLVLLLAHKRGVGRHSRWLPYIATLPLEPSCGYSKVLRPYLLDSIHALREELGLDVNGRPGELLKATQYAKRIANALARDYGTFIQHPKGLSAVENSHGRCVKWRLEGLRDRKNMVPSG